MKHIKEFIGWFIFWLCIPIVIIWASLVRFALEHKNKKVRKYTRQAIKKFSKVLKKLSHE